MLRQLVPALAGLSLLPSAALALPQTSRAISGWVLYCKEKRKDAEAQLGTKLPGEVQEQLGKQWRALSEEDKAEYKRRGADIPAAEKPPPRDPNKPKPPTAWNQYVKERARAVRAEVLESGSFTDKQDISTEVFRKLGVEYKALSDAEKQAYKDRAAAPPPPAKQEQ